MGIFVSWLGGRGVALMGSQPQLVAGLLVPVPLLMLHVVEALVQAYIFGTLALIYIASGMQSQAADNPHQPDNGGEDQ